MDKETAIDPILIEVPTPITTPRMMLRAPQAGDGKVIHEATLESWPELLKWTDWARKHKGELTVKDVEAFYRRRQAQFILREGIPLLSFNRQSGKFLGGAGLNRCDWEHRIFMISYWVRTGETNQGYATEIATALARYAFNALSARKVSIFHVDGNTASQRVIEKVGFEKEGVLRQQHGFHDGTLIDEHIYGLLDEKKLPPLDVQWGEP